MITNTYTLPSHWACALVNDDTSGMEDEDEAEMDAWLAREGPGYCVGVSGEPEFRTSNDAGTLACDCLTFVFHR